MTQCFSCMTEQYIKNRFLVMVMSDNELKKKENIIQTKK